ncbi:MAG: hypothetical protein ACM3WV_08265 [Bacillota bacterium]
MKEKTSLFQQIMNKISEIYNIPAVKYTIFFLAAVLLAAIIWLAVVHRKKLWEIIRTGLWDEDEYRRMFAGFLWGLPIFLIGWLIGYFLLKEGQLQGTFLAAKLYGVKGSALVSTLKLIAHNLTMILLGVIVLNHVRAGKFPLGYVFFFIYVLSTSMIVGSASYMYYISTKIKAFDFFKSFGIAEMIAYLFFVAATASLSAFQVPLTASKWEKVRELWPVKLRRDQIEVFLWGLAFLAISIFAEMRLILFYHKNS